jgi:hypothetical protein
MKIKTIYGFRNSALCAACLLLAAGAAEAKPDKGNSGKGGGKAEHSEKGKGGGKHDNKGKKDKHDDTRKDAEKHGKDAKKDHKEAHKADDKLDKEVAEWRKKRFRDEDRNGVIKYFSDYSKNEYGLPPGLAKNYRNGKPLPPGWQKKVQNGYVIDDGMSGYFQPLEHSLFPGLEVVPDTRLYLYGNRLVRVYEPRREVIDIFEVPTIRLDR